MVAIERARQRGRGDVGFFDGVDRAAKLSRHDLGAVDRLRGATRDLEDGFVGRMNGAEESGGRKARLLDAPQQPVAIDEVVRARGLGRGEPLNLGEIRTLTGLRRLGVRQGKRERADQECRGAQRQSTHDAHSFLSATSSILWLAPFVRSKSARGRVGRMFSCRLTRLMRRQMERAVASASASLRSAYWRK